MRSVSRIGLLLLVFTSGCGLMTYDVYRQAGEKLGLDADGGTPPDEEPPDVVRPDVEEVRVASGVFTRGCRAWLDASCDADEAPARDVVLGAFALDRTEVMRIAYQACVHAGECATPACDFDPFENPTMPLVCVTWEQAAAYCAWMGRRLPTEAEWERAARGTDVVHPWGNDAPDCARTPFAGCMQVVSQAGAHPSDVGESGAVDLGGNVSEWVADWYDAQSYAFDTTADPRGPLSGELRVVRGGSVEEPAASQRASARAAAVPTTFHGSLGFRCARTLPPGAEP